MTIKKLSKHLGLDRLYKTLIGLFLGIVFLLLLLQLLILLPPVQNKLKSVVISTLRNQIHANVTIDKFSLGFPKKLKIHDILIAGPEDDMLFYTGKFEFNRFLDDFTIGGGVGIRLDIDYFVIRLDAGIPLRKTYLEGKEKWIFHNTGFFSDYILSLALGHPF